MMRFRNPTRLHALGSHKNKTDLRGGETMDLFSTATTETPGSTVGGIQINKNHEAKREVPTLSLADYVRGTPEQKQTFIDKLWIGLKDYGKF